MDYTSHTMLAGDQATAFAVEMGFKGRIIVYHKAKTNSEESLTTPQSQEIWAAWKKNLCQPNYWKNVLPNNTQNCGPYKPAGTSLQTL